MNLLRSAVRSVLLFQGRGRDCSRTERILSLGTTQRIPVNRDLANVRTARMSPLARLPAFFALEGKRCVVAGGGLAAVWKAELLSAARARVDVLAPEPSDDVRALAAASPAPRAPPACRSTSSIGRSFAISRSARSSTARRSSSAFQQTAPRRYLA